ncbi:hypothetical protein P43SY_008166 [Pythium insidiosum]|uniref:THH1/TOM1/TOM3 domain-containing protein n=1 Tax=Pythium insidiosum TaxID=114742 RepID=A0AAD5LDR3_PYTIN|nr:hypothetical protein P43SY_008166 [Pythium insidiosum]
MADVAAAAMLTTAPSLASANATDVDAPVIRVEFQYRQVDTILAVAYGLATFFAFWAFAMHAQSPSRQTATLGFYLLMGLAALTRTLWFSSPFGVMSVIMEPPRLSVGDDGWIEFLASEVVELLGSYLLYSIFVLIVVFWADMLRRLFTHDMVRSHPLRLFFILLGAVMTIQALGIAVFVTNGADSYGLMLYDDILLMLVSLASLIAITVYSYKMKTVLQAFLEVSQIDTTDRIKAVNWASAICSVFLVFNTFLLCYSTVSIAQFHRVDVLLDAKTWWLFVASKHLLEIIALYLLLYSFWGKSSDDEQRKDGYEQIPDVLSDEDGVLTPKRLH